jgi:hypothetical protein
MCHSLYNLFFLKRTLSLYKETCKFCHSIRICFDNINISLLITQRPIIDLIKPSQQTRNATHAE